MMSQSMEVAVRAVAIGASLVTHTVLGAGLFLAACVTVI
jgi:hypothetical protein